MRPDAERSGPVRKGLAQVSGSRGARGCVMGPLESPNDQLVARLLLQAAQTVLPDEPFSQDAPTSCPGKAPRRRPLPGDGDSLLATRPRQCPIRVVLVCGPPRSGKSTYIVETFDGVVEPLPFETVTYRNFLSNDAYPRVMPPRRREMIALAIFQEFTENAIRRCQIHAAEAMGASAEGAPHDPVVVMEGPFYYRSFRHVVADGLRGVLRECDALECRWVGYPRVVSDAVRRAGYDTFKHCAGRLQVPSVEEGFDELRVLAVPQRPIRDDLRLRVDALNERDAVTEHNLLCRPDLSADELCRSDSARPLCAVSDLEGRKLCGARA